MTKVKKVVLRKTKAYRRPERPDAYLKYHKLVMSMAKRKFELSSTELDLILFLYDEDIFTRTTVKTYSRIMNFNGRIVDHLVRRELIRKWFEDPSRRYPLFELTRKAKYINKWIYDRLNGEEPISEFHLTKDAIAAVGERKTGYQIVLKQKAISDKKKDDKARRRLEKPQ